VPPATTPPRPSHFAAVSAPPTAALLCSITAFIASKPPVANVLAASCSRICCGEPSSTFALESMISPGLVPQCSVGSPLRTIGAPLTNTAPLAAVIFHMLGPQHAE